MFNPAIQGGWVRHARKADRDPPPELLTVWGDDLPASLLGPERDPALFERDTPANRAVRNAERIRAAALPIYLECGDDDSLLFQDGAEFLHRVLWDLDLSHEFRLTAGADHVGPTLLPRLRAAFLWLGERLAPALPIVSGEEERVWSQWLAQGGTGPEPAVPLDPGTRTMLEAFRRQMAAPRARASLEDPTANRRFGLLPPTAL